MPSEYANRVAREIAEHCEGVIDVVGTVKLTGRVAEAIDEAIDRCAWMAAVFGGANGLDEAQIGEIHKNILKLKDHRPPTPEHADGE